MSTETTQTQPRARTSPLLTLAEASAITRTPIASLRRWIADGRLPAKRPGRLLLVRKADLAALVGCSVEELG